MPLPPYIIGRRPADAQDMADYQTVFAQKPGAVAAPTASLHFDEALVAALAGCGVLSARLTLHVGAGTFLPVTAAQIEAHRMHAEWGEISRSGPGDQRRPRRRRARHPGRHDGAEAAGNRQPTRPAGCTPSAARPRSSSRPATGFARSTG